MTSFVLAAATGDGEEVFARLRALPPHQPVDAVVPVCRAGGDAPVIHASALQTATFGETRAFTRAHERLARWMREFANVVAEGDSDLSADLEQEARVLLWELDPSRLDASDDAWLRRKLRARMRRVAEREGRVP